MSRIHSLVPMALMLALAGCGGSSTELPEVFSARGMVRIDGKPGDGVAITYLPSAGTPGPGGYAMTQADGSYVVTSHDGREGVPAGDYRVLLTKWRLPDGSPIPEGQTAADVGAVNLLAPIYCDPSSSPAVVKITSGQNMQLDIDAKSLKGGKSNRLAQR